MDDDTASKFVSSLVKTIQSLCNGYIDFTSSIEVIGHIHLNIDRNLKFNYVLSEEVNKSESEAATVFSSHSYHSHPPPSITSGSAKLSPNQNNKADHSRRKSQVAQADESAPLIVPPGFSPASRDSFTSGRSDEDVTQDSASYSEKDNAYSPAQRGIFGTTAPTEEPMDRRRKLCSEMAPSLRPPEPASKRSRTVGHSSANAAKPKFEVIEVKEEPSDDGTDSFHDENKQSAMQDISQPDFSNLVADSLDRVGQMEGASLLAGTDSGQQPPFPVTLHANQAAVVGQPSASAAPVSGLSDPQGGQVSAGIAAVYRSGFNTLTDMGLIGHPASAGRYSAGELDRRAIANSVHFPPKYGRPYVSTRIHMACLDVELAAQNVTPNQAQLEALTAQGLGVPRGAADRSGKIDLKNGRSAGEFQEKLCELFPRLIPGHFSLCQATKGRVLQHIPDWQALPAEAVKKVLKQGRLYITPFVLRPPTSMYLPAPPLSAEVMVSSDSEAE